jgi:hypothetical protein
MKPKRKPYKMSYSPDRERGTPHTTGGISFGEVHVPNIVIRFIDWLNNKNGATKPKQTHPDEQIIYGNVPKWFEDEMSSRPRNQRESFYHPPPEVIHTPHEWIDGESSGRHYGAWRPIE